MAETLRAQLRLLYHTGKVTFPERAETLAATLETIADVRAAWSAPTVRAGSPPALTQAMEINASVYHLLRRAVLSWQDAAHAMVSIADDFVATDDAAATAVHGVGFDLDDLPMPHLVEPPTLAEAQE